MATTVSAEEALNSGNTSLAFELFDRHLEQHSDDLDARYGAALAAARLGSISVAERLLQPMLEDLPREQALRVNCLSLMGRLEKDRYARESENRLKHQAALKSAEAYAAAYQHGNDFYPGANAATMYRLAREHDKAAELVELVLPSCLEKLDGGETADPWLAATLGELFLLKDDFHCAHQWYQTAAQLMAAAIGNIASMRRQLRLLNNEINVADELFDVLNIPTVVTVTGHMIDMPDAAVDRFPSSLEPLIKQKIEQYLQKLGAGIAYCSAACGVDILFAEAMLERGGEVHICLPFATEDFLSTSVEFAGPKWVERFDTLLENATSVRFATLENYLGDDLLFAYNADVITGEMLMRAERLEVKPEFLAVYDFDGSAPTGGSHATADSWQQQGFEVTRIDMAKLRADAELIPVQTQRPLTRNKPNTVANPRAIRAMVFADVVGFSKLGEADTPHFFVGLLSAIAELTDRYAKGNEFKNTWGDGLFLVFDQLTTAAAFALDLRDLLNTTDWSLQGLPASTNIRIALHVGPVYPAHDPILGCRNFFGSHVNQAARMEPITSPGSVFVSDQAAALIKFHARDHFACDYLGPAALPKDAGTIGLHRLRRSTEIE